MELVDSDDDWSIKSEDGDGDAGDVPEAVDGLEPISATAEYDAHGCLIPVLNPFFGARKATYTSLAVTPN